MGERLEHLADAARLDVLYACLLLSPHVPMLFMGEEFAASTPFLYFCDFDGELGEAVSQGRRAEFGRFAAFADPERRAKIPDPNAAHTHARSVLQWAERAVSPHRERLALVRGLLALRQRHLVPRLDGPMHGGRSLGEGDFLHVRWRLADGSGWEIAANFGEGARDLAWPVGAQVVWPSVPGSGPALAPWSARVLHLPEHP